MVYFHLLPSYMQASFGFVIPLKMRYVLAQKCLGILGSFPVRDPGANRANQESRPGEDAGSRSE